VYSRYRDDDNELVSISTDSDLKEAIAYSTKNADILRLYIQRALSSRVMLGAPDASGWDAVCRAELGLQF
jgi:hypothetical protein